MFFMVLCSGNKYVYLDTITIRAGEYKYTYTIDWTDVDRGYDGRAYPTIGDVDGDGADELLRVIFTGYFFICFSSAFELTI